MIGLTPRSIGRWAASVVVGLASGAFVGGLAGVLLAYAFTRDPDDDPWESLGDVVGAAFLGIALGLIVALVVLAIAIDRWLAPGRGVGVAAITVPATIGAVGVAVVLLSSFDDGHGPEDVFVGWAIIPPIVAAQWFVAQMISARAVAGILAASAAVMVFGAVIL